MLETSNPENQITVKVALSSPSLSLQKNPNNPYSVTNMIKAYQDIMTKSDFEKAKTPKYNGTIISLICTTIPPKTMWPIYFCFGRY
jgi:hypothetical protein